MLLQWPEFPYKPEEQVLGMLFDGGMLTRDQLQILSGFTESKVIYCVRRIRKRWTETPMIKDHFLPGRSKGKMYSLTIDGARYVYEMMGIEHCVRRVPEGQLLHYFGINSILVRAVQRFGRDHVTWLSSREVTEELALARRLYGPEEQQKGRMVRPDAAIEIHGGHKAWVEYDNATESTAKLEAKFRGYVNLYKDIGKYMRPILWVVPNEARQNYLQRLYRGLKKQLSWPDEVEHIFFVEGQEQEWLADKNAGAEQRV
jgi:hypothetical protein